jgi:hypothetical protein
MCCEVERSLGPSRVINSCVDRVGNTRDNSWYTCMGTDTVVKACRVKASKDQKLIYCHTEGLALRQDRWRQMKKGLWLKSTIEVHVKPPFVRYSATASPTPGMSETELTDIIGERFCW